MPLKINPPALCNAKTDGISRRDFGWRAALAAVGVVAISSDALAGTQAPAPASPTTAQQPAEAPKLSPESRAEAEAKIQNIFRKYGSRLSEEQKTDVRRLALEGQKPLESLRAFPLENGDEPATVLKLSLGPASGVRRTSRTRRSAR